MREEIQESVWIVSCQRILRLHFSMNQGSVLSPFFFAHHLLSHAHAAAVYGSNMGMRLPSASVFTVRR